ncbi:pilin [Thioflexithrix psekupsensis]|uniref:Pilin n=1 Tax=Thioflexithrix psekupsensis TaxID=1570016 RepID=A0A251X6B6_9GAMM|nr:pilin [Thioflexithrix psekupsensis]OUD13178.1 hypothetical protein TPSD3_11085 [Thioflexithrix psekupsensis]
MTSSDEIQITQDKKPPSKASWLIVAVIIFVLGAGVCGTGSAIMVLFAAALTLPAVLSKWRIESGLGVILLSLCLAVGWSIYSKHGFGGEYWNYLQRGKVQAALSLLEQLKSPIEQFYATQHTCPTPAQIGAVTSNKYVTNILLNNSNGEKCIYTAVLDRKSGFPANTTLGLAYLIQSNRWSCYNKDAETTQMAPIYLPSKCKE